VRAFFFAVLIAFIAMSAPSLAGECLPQSSNAQETRAIVVGFVGGFVRPDDQSHGEVPMVEQLRAAYGDRVRIQLFTNRDVDEAHQAILRWMGQPRRPLPIILFGNSWGASAAIVLARKLQADGVAVLLTIQVDSISRHGEDNSLIPGNVAEAVNFYQTRGILRGRQRIIAEDPTRTRILGNFLVEYKSPPAECQQYPWYDRLLTPGHISIDCDPQLWARVAVLIREHLQSVRSIQ
jgi:hypothetical protein